MSTKLFVGNISFQAQEDELRQLFEQAGAVQSVRIIVDQFSGRSRGFGFVEMTSAEDGQKAIRMFNGHVFKDRALVVDQARSPQRGEGGRGPGGPRRGPGR